MLINIPDILIEGEQGSKGQRDFLMKMQSLMSLKELLSRLNNCDNLININIYI